MSNQNEFNKRNKVKQLIAELELGLSKSELSKTDWDKMIKRLGVIHHIYGQITPRNDEKHNVLITIDQWVRVFYSDKYSYYYMAQLKRTSIFKQTTSFGG